MQMILKFGMKYATAKIMKSYRVTLICYKTRPLTTKLNFLQLNVMFYQLVTKDYLELAIATDIFLIIPS